jgi:hypothetical protein
VSRLPIPNVTVLLSVPLYFEYQEVLTGAENLPPDVSVARMHGSGTGGQRGGDASGDVQHSGFRRGRIGFRDSGGDAGAISGIFAHATMSTLTIQLPDSIRAQVED